MPKRKLNPILEAQRAKAKIATKKALTLAANEAVNFFTENFRRQGFLDRSLKKWRKRKGNTDPGRGVLIGKGSGAKLNRSIDRTRLTNKRAVIGVRGAPTKYAAVHNFGLRSGRGRGFIMPKRQFMGRSRTLDKKIDRLLKRTINKVF